MTPSRRPPSASTSSLPPPPPPPPFTTQPSLRFPVLETDDRIDSWFYSSCPDVMSTRSETPVDERSVLGESAYEFVDTDTESRDDNATESVASTDYGRPEDVASLADTDNSDDESEAEVDIPSFSGLDGPAATPTIGRSMSMRDVDRDNVSIEFEEPLDLDDETISVRHTVANFDEHQTATIAKYFNFHARSKRLAASVRQTMSKQGLSTREPLRLLYVGSHAAKQDIIHKIASAVTASTASSSAYTARSTSSQMYNVVPVTAFGSEKTPEIELMHSSGIQISVEDCVAATALTVQDESSTAGVIKLTVEDNFSYHSVPDGPHFAIEPEWEPPNVAIIYCSENDSHEMLRTRHLVSCFMGRHGIPSIVISHKLALDRPPLPIALNGHAPHICLESRDPRGSGTFTHQRLPIDLSSFLNIDARQMNRNLAYLTTSTHGKKDSRGTTHVENYQLDKGIDNYSPSRHSRTRTNLLTAAVTLLTLLLAVSTGVIRFLPKSVPAVSINGNLSTTVSKVFDDHDAIAPSSQAFLSTHTSTQTATRTVTVVEPKIAAPSSVAIVPFVDPGKLAGGPRNEQAQAQSPVCSAEIIGDREVLIRIPYSTKSSWLSKEAISLNITRDNKTVEAERVYSSDEGILLQFPRKEAFGYVNISVVTSRKPRLNETVSVNFGMNWQSTVQDTVSWLSTYVHNGIDQVNSWVEDAVTQTEAHVQAIVDKARERESTPLTRYRDFVHDSAQRLVSSNSRVVDAVYGTSRRVVENAATFARVFDRGYSFTREELMERLSLSNQLDNTLSSAFVKAQVQARLYALKMMGKKDEYAAYAERATRAFQERAQQASSSRGGSKQRSGGSGGCRQHSKAGTR